MEGFTQQAYKALMLDEIEEYEELIEFLSAELVKNPGNAVLFNNRSLAYSEIGRYPEALKDIKEANEIDPRNETVTYNLRILERQNENT